jgi:hypothetical protein
MALANSKRWGIGVATVLAGWALLAQPAQACSPVSVAIAASYPMPDAEDVPTNAVLFADGHELAAADFQLTDQSGNPIPISVRAVEAGGFDIEPVEELPANRGYLLSVPARPGTSSNIISFTTGSGPAQLPDTLPVPAFAPTRVIADGMCRTIAYCTGTQPLPQALLEVRVGRRSLLGDPLSGMVHAFDPGAQEGCLSIRARDIRGHRSAAAVACGDAIHDYEGGNLSTLDCAQVDQLRRETPDPSDVVVEAPPVVDEAASVQIEVVPSPTRSSTAAGGGCALNRSSSGSPAATWLALGTCWAFAARVRRRRPQAPSL